MKLSYKLGLIGCLYISEGLPFGFFTQALPALLRESGFTLTQISLTSLLALPWALKFLWAPLVDRFYSAKIGRRKSWLVPIQLASAAVLVATALLGSQEYMPVVLIAVLLCNLLAATLDIAADGLAVQLLKPNERGYGNGIQVAGYRVGMVISGGFLLIVFDDLGWSGSFLLMAGILLLLTIPVLLFKEPPAPEATAPISSSFKFVVNKNIAIWLGILFTYKLCEAVGAGMVKPYLIDSGFSKAELGWISGTFGFAAALIGALAGGAAASKFGAFKMAIVFAAFQVIGILAFAVSSYFPAEKTFMYAVVIGENLVSGMVTAAIFTLMMSFCRPQHEGNDYTVQASAFAFATGIAMVISGPIAQALGYSTYFLLSAAAATVAIVVLIASRKLIQKVSDQQLALD